MIKKFHGDCLRLLTLLLISATASGLHQSTGSLIAIIDMHGFRGSIEFISNSEKEPFEEVLIRVNVKGPSNNDKLTWSLWEYPPDLTQKDPCDTDKVEKELMDLTGLYGYLRTGQKALIHDTFKALKLSSIFERALLLQSIRYGLPICTTIRSSLPLTSYEARFLSPISGHFVIRQLPNVATALRSDLLWTSGVQENRKVQWSLVKIQQSPERHAYEESLFQSRTCSYLWELISADLTAPLHSSDASTDVNVGGGQRPKSRTFSVDTNFTSLEGMDTSDVWVILRWSPQEFVACAPLWTVHPREAVAEFRVQPDYVKGSVHFYQSSGYGDATVVTVNLTLPNRNAAGFGIDELTLPAKAGFREGCTSLALAYFNPLRVHPQSSPPPLLGTTDRYPLGDLSGTMGSLLNKATVHSVFFNQYLTLHGPNGIIGRTLTLYEDSWYPLTCANLQTLAEELEAVAVFQGPVKGKVTFRQYLEEPLDAHTTVHIDLRHSATDSDNVTHNHQWRIFTTAPHTVQKRTILPSTSQPPPPPTKATCPNLGQIYNPYGVIVSSTYGCDCNPKTAVRCANGDLSGRLGPITIGESREAAETSGKELTNGHFFSSSGLWLNGDFSVVGMMLAIYDSNFSDRIVTCAPINLKGS